MSNPAIVLMTDPSRCNLGDVQYLVQALLEMQQMGEHALPQAFCDHPEAARDFLDAYAHTYPQLVLEDREIPTPDHLHSLISTGQVGALGRAVELTASHNLQPPATLEGANSVPIVMLTLGGSQVLFEALQQVPSIRESIRLIDVGQERGDAVSVAVADAVSTRGLDGEPWQQERSRTERPELDDIPGTPKADLASLALHDDPMSLEVLETAEVSSREPSAYAAGGEPEPAPAPAAPPAAPTKAAAPAAEERPGSTTADDARAGATATEPASERASQPVAARPSEVDPAEPADGETVEPEAQSLQPEAPASDEPPAKGGSAPRGQAADKGSGSKESKKPAKDLDKEVDAVEKGGKGAPEQDDDVCYPPVGTLLAGADVLYPALDGGSAHGALHELASVLLDDGFADSDLAAEFIEAQRGEGMPAPARQEAIIAVRSGDNVVTLEAVYDACDQDGDDQLADAGMTRPLHDSDL